MIQTYKDCYVEVLRSVGPNWNTVIKTTDDVRIRFTRKYESEGEAMQKAKDIVDSVLLAFQSKGVEKVSISVAYEQYKHTKNGRKGGAVIAEHKTGVSEVIVPEGDIYYQRTVREAVRQKENLKYVDIAIVLEVLS